MNEAMEVLIAEALAECLYRVEQSAVGTEEAPERMVARGREMYSRNPGYHDRMVWLARYITRRLSKCPGGMQVRLHGGMRDGEIIEVRDRTTRFSVAAYAEPGEDSKLQNSLVTQEYAVTTELFGAGRVAVAVGAPQRV